MPHGLPPSKMIHASRTPSNMESYSGGIPHPPLLPKARTAAFRGRKFKKKKSQNFQNFQCDIMPQQI
jgi:hypothetical protein